MDVPLNNLKEGEEAKLDIVDAVVVGGIPTLALTMSRFSSSLLSPSGRVLWTLLVALTFMASFPACPCSSVRIQVYCQGAKGITLLIEYSGHGMYLHRYQNGFLKIICFCIFVLCIF